MSDTTRLGLIPARGGSKGVPRKNIRSLAGEPLIGYSIQVANNATEIDSTVVSTDDNEIADVARSAGAEVPFMRPAELARDETPTEPVVQHAIKTLRELGQEYDDVVLLQPTSPLRAAAHIDEAVELYESRNADSLISGYRTYDTRWTRTSSGAEKINYLDAPARRQDREPEFVVNGAIYIVDVTLFLETNELKSGKTVLYEMDKQRSIDVDTPFDLWMAEQIVSEWNTNG
jgi:CMP-N-acetylneuraminic acid synthetase